MSPLLIAAPVRFLRELQAQEVDEGGTARLCCELSRAGASVEWRKGLLQLFPCAKYQMVQEGVTVELLVHNAEQEDAGHYTCDTGHTQSTARLSVRGELPAGPCLPWAPQTFWSGEWGVLLSTSKSLSGSLAPRPMFQTELQDAEQEVGSLARLCCQLNEVKPAAPVQWLKEGVELHMGSKYEMRHQGAMCELLIHGLEAKDSGQYACVVDGQKTMASVKVRGEPFPNGCPVTPSLQVLFQGWLSGSWGYKLSILISASLSCQQYKKGGCGPWMLPCLLSLAGR